MDAIQKILAENSLKGEVYRIKFFNDPITYEGIPLLRSHFTMKDELIFRFQIFKPRRYRGIVERPISEIERIEKKG